MTAKCAPPPYAFSHPDFTVGSGTAPDRLPQEFADFTAGMEFHQSPKTIYIILLKYTQNLKRAAAKFATAQYLRKIMQNYTFNIT